MLRVYLDQNKWVDLSKGLRGTDERFSGVATVVAAAVKDGRASFPLSAGHVVETWKRRKAGPRQALAGTMASISKNHSVAPPWVLVPAEIDRALAARFGSPTALLPLQPFGVGMIHRHGSSELDWGQPLVRRILEANPGLDQRKLRDQLDASLLAGPPEDLPVAGIPLPPMGVAEGFAQGQNNMMKIFMEQSSDKDERRRAAAANMLLDLNDQLAAGLLRAGLGKNQILELGADGITAFMSDLPSRAGVLELAWLQYDNLQTAWVPNDLNDIMFLSLATAYCDVVITERKWTAMLNRTGVPERFGTTVLSNLADLTDLLIADSVT